MRAIEKKIKGRERKESSVYKSVISLVSLFSEKQFPHMVKNGS